MVKPITAAVFYNLECIISLTKPIIEPLRNFCLLLQSKIADLSVNPDYAGLIGAADRDIDRIGAAVGLAAADETMRNFAAVTIAAASAAALITNILPATAVPVSAIVLLSMAGPLYLAQHVNLVNRPDSFFVRKMTKMGK